MGNCCCCCCRPAEPEPTPTPDGGGPQLPERCTRYRLTIVSMNVTAVDDGFLGGTLEATFTFVVNGQARTWVNGDLGEGTHNIGITFFVDVPAETSTITLEVSGVEEDPVWDDDLAGFTHVWGQAQNWGVGFQSGSASDSNITYTLNYEIVCAQQASFAVARSVLMTYAQDRAKKRKKVEAPTEGTLLSWGLDRFRRADWELVQSTEQQYVFKGYGDFPVLVERKYAKRERAK